jgi:hypothetical protein
MLVANFLRNPCVFMTLFHRFQVMKLIDLGLADQEVGGLECVGHSFAYIADFVFLRDLWIRT